MSVVSSKVTFTDHFNPAAIVTHFSKPCMSVKVGLPELLVYSISKIQALFIVLYCLEAVLELLHVQ